mmetsp:Transcript_12889/g.38807  ORF Transcript_12889/g.38807 Transcript_12889/m.38807 type:complete len:313 (+) Transcript_12889:540-1478(+)
MGEFFELPRPWDGQEGEPDCPPPPHPHERPAIRDALRAGGHRGADALLLARDRLWLHAWASRTRLGPPRLLEPAARGKGRRHSHGPGHLQVADLRRVGALLQHEVHQCHGRLLRRLRRGRRRRDPEHGPGPRQARRRGPPQGEAAQRACHDLEEELGPVGGAKPASRGQALPGPGVLARRRGELGQLERGRPEGDDHEAERPLRMELLRRDVQRLQGDRVVRFFLLLPSRDLRGGPCVRHDAGERRRPGEVEAVPHRALRRHGEVPAVPGEEALRALGGGLPLLRGLRLELPGRGVGLRLPRQHHAGQGLLP